MATVTARLTKERVFSATVEKRFKAANRDQRTINAGCQGAQFPVGGRRCNDWSDKSDDPSRAVPRAGLTFLRIVIPPLPYCLEHDLFLKNPWPLFRESCSSLDPAA